MSQVLGLVEMLHGQVNASLTLDPVVELRGDETVETVIGQTTLRGNLLAVNHGHDGDSVPEGLHQALGVVNLLATAGTGTTSATLTSVVLGLETDGVDVLELVPGKGQVVVGHGGDHGEGAAVKVDAGRGSDHGTLNDGVEVELSQGGTQVALEDLVDTTLGDVTDTLDSGQTNGDGVLATLAAVLAEGVEVGLFSSLLEKCGLGRKGGSGHTEVPA